MSLVKRSQQPFDAFSQFRKEMNDWMGSWFGRPVLPQPGWVGGEQLVPPVDLQESEGQFVVRMDIPGAHEDDIKVHCQGDVLTITGERKQQRTEEKANVHYTERQYGMFARSLTLPAAIKATDVRARYQDGVLEVQLPKAEKTMSREIKVERGKK